MRMNDDDFYEIWDQEAIQVLTTPKPVVRDKEAGWILLNHCEVEEVRRRTIARFLELKEKDPQNIGYRYALAELYRDVGDAWKSLSEYEQIVVMDRGEFSARFILVNSYWSAEYEENGANNTEAKEQIFALYRELLDQFPQHEVCLRYAYGIRLFHQNRFKEAAEQLISILCGLDQEACRILGISLVSEERYLEAIAPLESSIREQHCGHGTHEALAIALEELGHHEEARERWRIAGTRYHPNPIDLREWKKNENGKWKFIGPAPGFAY